MEDAKRLRPQRLVSSCRNPYTRRKFLKLGASALVVGLGPELAAANTDPKVVGVRVWPAADYTRVAIESTQPLEVKEHQLGTPERLVIDLQGLTLDQRLRDIVAQIHPDDPHIKGVRVGQFSPQIVRLVVDLKGAVSPKVFSTAPAGRYGYRLMVDLYAASASVESTSSLQVQSHAHTNLARKLTIAIDPGHGGEDPGAIGGAGTYEKHVVLDIAHRLNERIRASSTMQAIMTRDDDFFVPLATRVAKAKSAGADLFVSIHADAFTTSAAHGSSVFALSEHGASSAAARWIAKSENASDEIGGLDLGGADRHLAPVLFDMSTTQQINDSLKYGAFVRDEIGQINQLHGSGVEQAAFAVLKAPDIPSILVETAFISNPEEEKKLLNAAYRQKMADAIFKGIQRYFESHPPLAHRVQV
ncbi:AMIN domain-containing protein [Burkholderia sp. Ax-1719]|nr:N-acetylmuramoyl-L-alanine amidase [Burkholderia sp. Ax-1719]NIE65267.1 AMIN domain-containing protein [Burkholderia sp. Ax-1719]